MAPSWRRFLKRCARAADRGERTIDAAIHALMVDFRAELPSSVLSTVRAYTRSPQRQLDGIGAALPQWPDTGNSSPMERTLRSSLTRHAEDGLQGRDLERATYTDTFEDRGRQRLRQFEQQLSAKDRRNVGFVLQVARAATSQAIGQVVKDLVETPSTAPKPGKRTRKMDLDEDLRGTG